MKKSDFKQGYGAAVANLVREHSEDGLAWFLIQDSGFSWEDFEKCGLEEYDLKQIRILFISNNSKQDYSTK